MLFGCRTFDYLFYFVTPFYSYHYHYLELTAEEEAVLDVPELSEKDLPEGELSSYLRSAKEVDSLKQWMGS